jgi:hypothetical protein
MGQSCSLEEDMIYNGSGNNDSNYEIEENKIDGYEFNS